MWPLTMRDPGTELIRGGQVESQCQMDKKTPSSISEYWRTQEAPLLPGIDLRLNPRASPAFLKQYFWLWIRTEKWIEGIWSLQGRRYEGTVWHLNSFLWFEDPCLMGCTESLSHQRRWQVQTSLPARQAAGGSPEQLCGLVQSLESGSEDTKEQGCGWYPSVNQQQHGWSSWGRKVWAVAATLRCGGSHVQVDPSGTWLLADSTECFPLICLCSEPDSPASRRFSELPDNLWITVSLLQSAQAHGHNLQLRSLTDTVILKQLPLGESDQVPGMGLWIISMLSHLFSLLHWQEITLISLFEIRKLLSGGNGIWHQVPIIWKHMQLSTRIYLSPIPCYTDL